MIKNQKGITLIALVITIIVLLILAGVSIAMLTGDNGILTQASKSSVNTVMGNAKDVVSLKASESVSDYYEKKYAADSSSLSEADKTLIAKTVQEVAYEAGKTVTPEGVTITEDDTNKKVTITYSKDSTKTTVGKFDEKGNLTWTDSY